MRKYLNSTNNINRVVIRWESYSISRKDWIRNWKVVPETVNFWHKN